MGIKVKSKYANGVKDIKPKTSMDSDATTIKTSRQRLDKPQFVDYDKRLNSMTNLEIAEEEKNRIGDIDRTKYKKALGSMYKRGMSTYSKGSKGIKTKKMC